MTSRLDSLRPAWRRRIGGTLRRWWRRLCRTASMGQVAARRLRHLRRRQDRLARRQARLEGRYWDHTALVNRLGAIERQLECLSVSVAPPQFGRAGTAFSSADDPPRQVRLVCSVVHAAADAPSRLGSYCYSYHFVYCALAGMLSEFFGEPAVYSAPKELDAALRSLAATNQPALHLAFLPLHHLHTVSTAQNAAFTFWEFPEVPNYDVAGNPRNNWRVVAEDLVAIFTASTFTREAMLRASVRAPIHLVRVPIAPEFFDVPLWEPGQAVSVETPCYWFGGDGEAVERVSPGADGPLRADSPGWPAPRLDLGGKVYTSVFNPFDERKDWACLLSAFLTVFSECDDATLVMKFAVSGRQRPAALEQFARCYASHGGHHRCRVAVACDYLTEKQMLELARASTFVVNSSRAEGACLPLQNFLGAGRPAVAPNHTALGEYIDPTIAFVPDSRREPTHIPFDASQKITTSWWPLIEDSLAEKLEASYRVVQRDLPTYRTMAHNARRQMLDFASTETVRRQLAAALAQLNLVS